MCLLYVPEKIGDLYFFSFFGLDFLKKMGDWNFIRLVSKRKWYNSFENENRFELTLNLNFVHKLCQILFSTFQVTVSLSFHLFLSEFFKYPFLGDLSKFNAQLIFSHAEVWKIISLYLKGHRLDSVHAQNTRSFATKSHSQSHSLLKRSL